ncbi:hypothetical protein ACHWQZ_G014444 [Mnemiopsis leidyi]
MSITTHEAKFIVGGIISLITLAVFVMYLTCPWTWLQELERRCRRRPWQRAVPRVVYRPNIQDEDTIEANPVALNTIHEHHEI